MRPLVSATGLLILLGAGCSGGIIPEIQASAADISVRAEDLPTGVTGLSRCPGSGPVDGYLKAHDKQPIHRPVAAELKGLQDRGAREGALAILSDKGIACASGQLGLAPKAQVVFNLVVKFGSDEDATKAWQYGFFGFKSPDLLRNELGLSQGVMTGLGRNSWIYDRSVNGEDIHVASWQHATVAAFVIVEHLSSDQAQQLAGVIEGRIH